MSKKVTVELTEAQANRLVCLLSEIERGTASEAEGGEHRLLLIDEMYLTRPQRNMLIRVAEKLKTALWGLKHELRN